MRRKRLVVLALLILTLVSGCGGCAGRERGKNSDYDRPKDSTKK